MNNFVRTMQQDSGFFAQEPSVSGRMSPDWSSGWSRAVGTFSKSLPDFVSQNYHLSLQGTLSSPKEESMDRSMALEWIIWLNNFQSNPREYMLHRLNNNMIVSLKELLKNRLATTDSSPSTSMTPWQNVNHDPMWNRHINTTNASSGNTTFPLCSDLDKQNVLAHLSWNGELPSRNYENPVYSNKVFLGGLPPDTDVECIRRVFGQHFNGSKNSVQVSFPANELHVPKRHAYLIYTDNDKVRNLLDLCTQELDRGNEVSWFYPLNDDKVEVIPWIVTDNSYPSLSFGSTTSLTKTSEKSMFDHRKTIFVGGVYGKINAAGLFMIMEQLFGDVEHVGIDTDRYKYPIGSARVTFVKKDAYFRAIDASFVEITTATFTKKIQIEPYLIGGNCSMCPVAVAPLFCREFSCFKYFCEQCNEKVHCTEETRRHRRISRTFKNGRSCRS